MVYIHQPLIALSARWYRTDAYESLPLKQLKRDYPLAFLSDMRTAGFQGPDQNLQSEAISISKRAPCTPSSGRISILDAP